MIEDISIEGKRRDARKFLTEAFKREDHVADMAYRMDAESQPVWITKDMILQKALEVADELVLTRTTADATREAINEAIYLLIEPFPIDPELNPENTMIYSTERLHKSLKFVMEKYGEAGREPKAGEVREFKPKKT